MFARAFELSVAFYHSAASVDGPLTLLCFWPLFLWRLVDWMRLYSLRRSCRTVNEIYIQDATCRTARIRTPTTLPNTHTDTQALSILGENAENFAVEQRTLSGY